MSNLNHTGDLSVHRAPESIGDHVAFAFVRFSRFLADVFFAKRYGPRAVVLETVAAVPGMVGALFQHLRSLRLLRDDRGFIRNLEAEAENERMHLMIYVTVAQPSFLERLIIIVAQVVFFALYATIYLFSPRTGHRIVGYLEEEAVKSYTEFLHCIDTKILPNPEAPTIARRYFQLSPEARLRDVVIATRADEIRHRDNNHSFADTADRDEPAFDNKMFFLAVAFFCGILLGGAYILEYGLELTPCILCILQRFFFFLVGALALLAFFYAKTKGMRKKATLALIVAALLGALLALRQVWLGYFPPKLPTPCAEWMGALGPMIATIFDGGGNCAERGFTILFLSLPEWSLLSFLFLISWSLWAWKKIKRLS